MIPEEDLIEVIHRSMDLIMSMESGPFIEPVITDKAVFIGDTHCAVDVTEKVFKSYSHFSKIVFLGDYVDRGNTGVENLAFILSRLIKQPDKIVILRGNHESPLVNERYGFLGEVLSKYGEDTYSKFTDLFSILPYATLVNGYLCVHGGIASKLKNIGEIKKLPLYDKIPGNPMAYELLWNDPRDNVKGFTPSSRGDNIYYYGNDVVDNFLENNNINGIIRGHETADGFNDSGNGKVTTVFSSRYHGLRAGALRMESGKFYRDYL